MKRKRICRRMTAVFVFGAAACCLRAGAAPAVGDVLRVLTVDQLGKIAPTGVVATAEQMRENASAAAAAKRRADAAGARAAELAQTVESVLGQFASGDIVVYRDGFVTGFTPAGLSLPPDTRIAITEFDPFSEGGGAAHRIAFASTHDLAGAEVAVARAASITGSLDEAFSPIPDGDVSVRPLAGSYTNSTAVYPYRYEAVAQAAPDEGVRQFFQVLAAVSDTGSGEAFDVSGGISGGADAVVEWGGTTLTFRGGLLVGAETTGGAE